MLCSARRPCVARLIVACTAIMLTAPASLAQERQKTVLSLLSVRREAIGTTVEPVIERILGNGLSGHLDYYTEFIDFARFSDPRYRDAVRDFLRAKYAGLNFDLVIANGDDALDFVSTYRDVLFAGAAIVFHASRDVRHIPNATGLIARLNFGEALESAVRLQPNTEQVVVVGGASAYDKFYVALARDQFKAFDGRLAFTYLAGLPTRDLLRRVATLPPHSIIFFTMLVEDGDGQKFLPWEVLDRVSAAANAPAYSWFTPGMSHGLVGGRLMSVDRLGTRIAETALRVLRGEGADTIPVTEVDWSVNEFDWRQLRRWGISESRLPAGSTLLYRQPGVWEQYRSYIIGVGLLLALQSGFIGMLLVQRSRRQEAERQKEELTDDLRRLAGRLIAAQEAERARIARDLHDDTSQQLAGLAIALSGLKRRVGVLDGEKDLRQEVSSLQQRTSALAESVRNLSHDLHPSALEHAGLVAALSAHCAELQRDQAIKLTFRSEGDFESADPDKALCLYRVAQEALRYVLIHSGAGHADVRLLRMGDRLELTIADNGKGFEAVASHRHAQGLGLVSINKRVRAAGGSVELVTELNKGTRVRVTIPSNPPSSAN